MTSIAVLIGNATYEHDNNLACCTEDVRAMTALVEATGRFDGIHAHTDMDADAMRDLLRDTVSPNARHDEIFFYFSGHGAQIGGELYYCGTAFDGGRPNETGVSHTEVLNLLRPSAPKLLVKVIDACYSGALLFKSERLSYPVGKEGFRSVLQFSSSKDDQTSWAGESLSAFTKAFLEACVRRTDGAVYYTDIANTLRDDFLENDDQTPFFINQGTGREALVSDAAVLASFKDRLAKDWGISTSLSEDLASSVASPPSAVPTFEELLESAEQRMTSPEGANAFIGQIFDGVIAKFDESGFARIFEKEVSEHSYYRETTAEEFMIRVLVRETRPDRLVTAEIEHVKQRTSPWNMGAAAAALAMAVNPQWTEEYTLSLNCSLERAQLIVSLTPKYRSLQRLKLILSCAPSLDHCYLFETVTLHPRTDWEQFSSSGTEEVRRWYKMDWNQSVDHVVQKICDGLTKSVDDHITATAKRLSSERG
ncbi:MAG: caspase domain-containing protein [Aliihoeflea sp.]